MKYNKLLLIITSILVLLPILVGVLTWDQLPEEMATHWGVDGTSDDTSSRALAVFGFPALLLVIHWVCIILTAFDHKHIDQNKKVYNMVLFITPLIFWFCSGIMYATTFGIEFDMFSLVCGLLGVVFVIIGNYMPKTSQNHTLGVKIKWTLQSEENWNATHRVAGKVWFITGLIMLACVFIPGKIALFVLIPVIVAAVVIPTVYSYKFYLKEKKEGKKFVKNKKFKKYYIISGIIVGVILVAVGFIMFTGDVEITYNDDGITIDSMYYKAVEIKYKDIGGTYFVDEYIGGSKVNGFNSAKLMLGIYENDTYGKYQRFTYTGNNGFVVIETMDEKYIILGAKDYEATRKLFDELTEHIAG